MYMEKNCIDEYCLPEALSAAGINVNNSIFRFRYDDYVSSDQEGNSLSEIIHSQIWHSTVEKLNDPFEVYFVRDSNDAASLSKGDLALLLSNTAMFKDKSNEEYIMQSFINNEFSELYGDIDAAIKSTMPGLRDKFRKHVAIACFTKNVDSRLMWGYYCAGFTGLCLIYNHLKLKEAGIQLREVIYTMSPPKIKLSEWIVRQRKKQPLDGLLDFATAKHKDWEREREYRSLFFLDHSDVKASSAGVLVNLNCNCLDGVIIGANYNKHAKVALLKHCNAQGIKTFEAHADLDNYRVSITSSHAF